MNPSGPLRLFLFGALRCLLFFSAFQLFPTAPLRLQELGSSLAESGRFLAVFTLGSSVGALFTGAIGDRIGHRRMMIFSSLVFMGSPVFMDSPRLW